MTQNQSKILSIEEQINALKEKKKQEIAKLEKAVGKKFIESFEVQNQSVQEITKLISKLKEQYNIERKHPAEHTNDENINNSVKNEI